MHQPGDPDLSYKVQCPNSSRSMTPSRFSQRITFADIKSYHLNMRLVLDALSQTKDANIALMANAGGGNIA